MAKKAANKTEETSPMEIDIKNILHLSPFRGRGPLFFFVGYPLLRYSDSRSLALCLKEDILTLQKGEDILTLR